MGSILVIRMRLSTYPVVPKDSFHENQLGYVDGLGAEVQLPGGGLVPLPPPHHLLSQPRGLAHAAAVPVHGPRHPVELCESGPWWIGFVVQVLHTGGLREPTCGLKGEPGNWDRMKDIDNCSPGDLETFASFRIARSSGLRWFDLWCLQLQQRWCPAFVMRSGLTLYPRIQPALGHQVLRIQFELL